MKYLDEFSDPELAGDCSTTSAAPPPGPGRSWRSAAARPTRSSATGIDQLLPDGIELIHGPGCPVCVTPLEMIDKALAIAARPDVIFCSFGDMLRVPGSGRDLFRVKSEGGDVRVVYSPLDALALARAQPRPRGRLLRRRLRDHRARQRDGRPRGAAPRARQLLACSSPTSSCRRPSRRSSARPRRRVAGFLAAGHVCTVMGTGEYDPLAETLSACRSSSPASSRSTSSRASAGPSSSSKRGAPSSRTPTREPSAGRATRPRAAMLDEVFEVVRPRLARHRRRSPRAAGGCAPTYRAFDAERRFRRRPAIDTQRVRRVPQRRGAPGPDQAARVPRLRRRVHAAHAARRDHGLAARAPAPPTTGTGARTPCLTRPRPGGDLRWLTEPRRRGLDLPAPAARLPRRSSWATAAAASSRPS